MQRGNKNRKYDDDNDKEVNDEDIDEITKLSAQSNAYTETESATTTWFIAWHIIATDPVTRLCYRTHILFSLSSSQGIQTVKRLDIMHKIAS